MLIVLVNLILEGLSIFNLLSLLYLSLFPSSLDDFPFELNLSSDKLPNSLFEWLSKLAIWSFLSGEFVA